MRFLKREYPNVHFSEHPTVNGFFAKGSKLDLLQIRRETNRLDKLPTAPGLPTFAYIPMDPNLHDFELIKALMDTIVPEVTLRYDPDIGCIVAEGGPEPVEQVRELLSERCRDIDQVVTGIYVVELTPPGMKSLGLGERFPKSMSVSVKATRLEFMNGVKISSKQEQSRVYLGTLNSAAR